MIDLLKAPKAALDYLSRLLDRNASANSHFVDDLPAVPPGVRDAFIWRIAQGHIRRDVPARRKLETRGPEALEVKWRDG